MTTVVVDRVVDDGMEIKVKKPWLALHSYVDEKNGFHLVTEESPYGNEEPFVVRFKKPGDAIQGLSAYVGPLKRRTMMRVEMCYMYLEVKE